MLFALADGDERGGEPLQTARPLRSGTARDADTPVATLSKDDAALVDRVRAGDLAAFRALYLQTYDALVGFGTALIRSRPDAEEVVQDVFAAVWERRAEWAPARSIAAYLFTAVRNRASKIRAHGAVVVRAEQDTDDMVERASAQPPLSPHAAAEAEELRRAVARAVAALPERRRLALSLRFGEGMSYAEIGEVLGVSEHAATLLVARAREALAPVLTPFRQG
jgi:RNA polymerase sigma-70 factor (ECF subfamily)